MDLQQEEGGVVTIQHGLNYGEMTDDIKSAFVVRGLGQPFTQTMKKFIPDNGLCAFPCLVVDGSSGEIESSLWALRGTHAWRTGHKARSIWGQNANPAYSVVLDIPNDEIMFMGSAVTKCFSVWTDAFKENWATVTDEAGMIVEDISTLPVICK